MVQAGMAPVDAIKAATSIPAEMLGLADRGSLEVDRRADFIVLDGDPIEDIANTTRISDVYIAGVAIDRAKLRATFLG
jgi:imidazolonepropionase-like amidohydrolase